MICRTKFSFLSDGIKVQLYLICKISLDRFIWSIESKSCFIWSIESVLHYKTSMIYVNTSFFFKQKNYFGWKKKFNQSLKIWYIMSDTILYKIRKNVQHHLYQFYWIHWIKAMHNKTLCVFTLVFLYWNILLWLEKKYKNVLYNLWYHHKTN